MSERDARPLWHGRFGGEPAAALLAFTSSLDFDLVPCPTAPDSRQGCLDGIWESYPALGFLNQGDCVSWIATEGKNEPGKNVP